MTAATKYLLAMLMALGMCAASFLSGCDQSGESGTEKLGNITKENVLKVTEGMSIDDAKLILGPPTNDARDLGLMEWGSLGTPGPYISLEFDKDNLKITRKRVIDVE